MDKYVAMCMEQLESLDTGLPRRDIKDICVRVVARAYKRKQINTRAELE